MELDGIMNVGSALGTRGFQVVIVVDVNDNSRMFPLLNDDTPLCLLPIANRKILAYQLDVLVASGITEAMLVAPVEYCEALNSFLAAYGRNNISLDLISVADMSGSVDALRAISDRVHSDTIVMQSDFVSQYLINHMADVHREKSADITMLFATPPLEESEKNSKITLKSGKIDDEDQEFVGLCEDGRLVIKTPAYEIEDAFKLNKSLLHKCATLTLRKDLLDMGCYILSRWVFQLVKSTTRFTSIRTDLLPFIIKRQFQTREYLLEAMPSLSSRKKPLEDLDLWLSAQTAFPPPPRSSLARAASFNSVDLATGPGDVASEMDFLKCFAVIKEHSAGPAAEVGVCRRVSGTHSYMALNRDMLLGVSPSAPWPRMQGYQKKELSVLGDHSVLGDKVAIKQCSIGRDCKIGAKSKINNCIVMDGVVIGDSCTIQNSIICSGVTIENNCSINDCQVGPVYRIPSGSKFKGEPLTN